MLVVGLQILEELKLSLTNNLERAHPFVRSKKGTNLLVELLWKSAKKFGCIQSFWTHFADNLNKKDSVQFIN